MKLRGVVVGIVALGGLASAGTAPSSAQRLRGFMAGPALGMGAVDVTRSANWDAGPMIGARLRWLGARSGVSLSVDVQPFEADGGQPETAYRAAYLMPAWELRAGTARVGAGIGLAAFRFDAPLIDGRMEYTTVAGASGAVRLSASFLLEVMWRRTAVLRGFRTNVWSIQLVRLWDL